MNFKFFSLSLYRAKPGKALSVAPICGYYEALYDIIYPIEISTISLRLTDNKQGALMFFSCHAHSGMPAIRVSGIKSVGLLFTLLTRSSRTSIGNVSVVPHASLYKTVRPGNCWTL